MAQRGVRLFFVPVLLLCLAIVVSAQRPAGDARVAQAARADSGVQSAPAPQPSASSASRFDSLVTPFLSENCYRCHGNKKHEKDLNFQEFANAASLIEHRERWEEVARKLKGQEMPPIEEDQPEEPQRQAVATWLEQEFDRIDRETPPDPGRVTARRLNRSEYNNTVRDLLGVDLHPADDFPQDDAGYGFDNIADVLSLSPVLMEKYVSSAEKVTRTALFGPATMKPTLTRLRSDGRRVRDAKTYPGDYDLTGLSLPNAFHAIYRVPVD